MSHPNAPHAPSTASPRILVIDDEATIRMALRRFFTRQGWQVDEAANGESGYSMILLDARQHDQPRYAVVLSDLRMPGLNGIELYGRLKASHPEIIGRLIFSTGDIVSEESAAFVRTTDCPVLQKPFELGTLKSAVQQLLRAAPTE
jgi:two-component system NtrC family sensor kinase